jgi:hypothetical protein
VDKSSAAQGRFEATISPGIEYGTERPCEIGRITYTEGVHGYVALTGPEHPAATPSPDTALRFGECADCGLQLERPFWDTICFSCQEERDGADDEWEDDAARDSRVEERAGRLDSASLSTAKRGAKDGVGAFQGAPASSAAQGRRSFPWEQLPEAAQRNIVAAMWVCLAVGFVAGVAVGVLLVE